MSETTVSVNPDLQTFRFDDPVEAAAFADCLNALVCDRLPWAQAVLGSFVTVSDEASNG